MRGALGSEWWGICPELIREVGGALDGHGVEKILLAIWSQECWSIQGRIEQESEREFSTWHLNCREESEHGGVNGWGGRWVKANWKWARCCKQWGKGLAFEKNGAVILTVQRGFRNERCGKHTPFSKGDLAFSPPFDTPAPLVLYSGSWAVGLVSGIKRGGVPRAGGECRSCLWSRGKRSQSRVNWGEASLQWAIKTIDFIYTVVPHFSLLICSGTHDECWNWQIPRERGVRKHFFSWDLVVTHKF